MRFRWRREGQKQGGEAGKESKVEVPFSLLCCYLKLIPRGRIEEVARVSSYLLAVCYQQIRSLLTFYIWMSHQTADVRVLLVNRGV